MIIPVKDGYYGDGFVLREKMVNGMTILGTTKRVDEEEAVRLVAESERGNKSPEFLEAFSRRQK